MKTLILTSLLAAVIGWSLTVYLQKAPASVDSTLKETFAGASLLGSREAAPITLPKPPESHTVGETATYLQEVDQASQAMLENWLSQLAKGNLDDQKNRQQMATLFSKLASLDPESAWELTSEDDGLESFRQSVLSTWAQQDMPAAVDKVIETDPKGYLMNGVMRNLTGEDAITLYDLLVAKGFDKSSPGCFGNIFGHLYAAGATQAADKALKHSLSRSDNHFGSNGLENVLNMWTRDDPESVFAWADGQSSPAAKEAAWSTLASGWSERDPLGSLQGLWGHLDAKQRKHLAGQLKSSSGLLKDPEEALNWVHEQIDSPIEREQILSGLLGGLRNSEKPEGLATLVPHIDATTRESKSNIRQAANRWANKDLDSLRDWLGTVEDPDIKAAATGGMLEALMSSNPDQALAILVDESTDPEATKNVSHYNIKQLFQGLNDPNSSPEELLARLPEETRGEALQAYAETFAADSPEKVLSYLSTQPEGDGRDRAYQRSLSRWAATEPDKAKAWVEDLPAGENREDATRNLVNNWARSDVQGASAWLETQLPGETRDLAALELATAQISRNPQAAFDLAQTLTTIKDRERDQLFSDSIQAMVRVDIASAERVLSQASLSENGRDGVTRAVEEAIALKKHLSNQ